MKHNSGNVAPYVCWARVDGIPKIIKGGSKSECILAANAYKGRIAYVFSVHEDKIVYIKDGNT